MKRLVTSVLALAALHCSTQGKDTGPLDTGTSGSQTPSAPGTSPPTLPTNSSATPSTGSSAGVGSSDTPTTLSSTPSPSTSSPNVDCSTCTEGSLPVTEPSVTGDPSSPPQTSRDVSASAPAETPVTSEAQSNTSSDEGDPPAPACPVYDGTRDAPLTLSGNTFAHDPTLFAANGTFYRFWTGDYIPAAQSTDLRNWTNAPTVYPRTYPSWVTTWRAANPGNTFNFPWAPDVSYFGGKYHLYSSFSAFFGRNISCITHLTTDDIAAGNWTDHGPVICSESGDSFNAIDADVGLDADGTPWLSFGSFWDGIFSFPLDQEGNRVGSELTHLAWAREIEAPVLFYHCGYYYLFVSWGLCCPGEGRSVDQLTYKVVVGRSENIQGPYLDREGVSMVDGGGSLVVQGDHQVYAAAGHGDVFEHDGRVYHVYHAYRQADAEAEMRIVELPFDDEGWPVGGAP